MLQNFLKDSLKITSKLTVSLDHPYVLDDGTSLLREWTVDSAGPLMRCDSNDATMDVSYEKGLVGSGIYIG